MKGFPFCAEAAREGRLDVLQWLRRHDCPWDEETGKWAAESGNWTLLRWVLDQEPEWAGVREVSEPEEEEKEIKQGWGSCLWILLAGPRKGELCGHRCDGWSDFCKGHRASGLPWSLSRISALALREEDEEIIDDESEAEEEEEEGTKVWCIWIILKGERKGDLCGRPSHGSDFCKFHKTCAAVCADRLAALRERDERGEQPEDAEWSTRGLRRHFPNRALSTPRGLEPGDFPDGDSAHDPAITKAQLDRELNQMRREREEFLRKEKFGRKKKCLKFPPRSHTVGCAVAGTDESDFCSCYPKGEGEEEAAGDERWAHEPGCDWEEGHCSCVVGWEEAARA